MSSMFWVGASLLASEIGFFSTLIVNSFLVHLIIFYTKQVFGAYKYLVLSFSLMGIVFATAEFIVKPMTHNYKASFTFFTLERPFKCSKETAMILLAAYSSTYAATISLLAVQFVYRYWAIFHVRRLSFFNGIWILFWIFLAMMFGVDWSCSVYFLGMPDKVSEDYLRLEISDQYNLNITRLAYFSAVVYDSEYHIRWRSVMVMGSVSKVLSIQYAVMIFCGVRMHFKMAEKMEQFSITNRKMHKQLFKTLVVQITVPTFTIFMPVMFMFLIPFFDLQLGIPTGVLLCALSLYPFIDGLIVISIVSDYRKAAIEVFRRILSRITCGRFKLHQVKKYDFSVSGGGVGADGSTAGTIARTNRVGVNSRTTASTF
ncbi:Seven TM Receptor [Caenorhabditis elegans]|uniref:Seven TM Receptor n=1 Tax=Caenorhabditis elegans TaxID=6239 RepID=P91984_CAEEL|nr:Seven TM Receptor [Caenorhabditis elegans]CAB02859.1 Seven TM Receptor [Caenorhabditis elegans]|eukprot:NP_506307.1 Seven TM Receptor [Caenorhabditis elegans]